MPFSVGLNCVPPLGRGQRRSSSADHRPGWAGGLALWALHVELSVASAVAAAMEEGLGPTSKTRGPEWLGVSESSRPDPRSAPVRVQRVSLLRWVAALRARARLRISSGTVNRCAISVFAARVVIGCPSGSCIW